MLSACPQQKLTAMCVNIKARSNFFLGFISLFCLLYIECVGSLFCFGVVFAVLKKKEIPLIILLNQNNSLILHDRYVCADTALVNIYHTDKRVKASSYMHAIFTFQYKIN